MKVTREWIHENCTARHGWTKKQLSILGIRWPPRHGWITRVEGMEISESAAKLFEALPKHVVNLDVPNRLVGFDATGTGTEALWDDSESAARSHMRSILMEN